MLLKFKKLQKKELFFVLLIPFLYLIIAFATIGHYGVDPDEPYHFRRGQAFLYFFLTGKKTYDGLPKPKQAFIPPWKENIVPETNPHNIRRSYYQSDSENGEYAFNLVENQGHPPISDIFSAITNYIFYQKLGILDDVDAHHAFGLITVAILIFSVYVFTRINYGIFAGIIAALAVFLYPVFLGESHFNIKDPPQASFFTLTIFFIWLGIVNKKASAILVAAVVCAFALGTKFNIFFLPFIIFPWILARGKSILKLSQRMYISFAFFTILVVLVFFIFDPNLWKEPIDKLKVIFTYYFSVGTSSGSTSYQPDYTFFGFNTYPILAIVYSTPLVILFFAIVGVIAGLKNFKKDKERIIILLLFWLLVPILRVSLPKTVIYGGIRHIFEYIPPLALFAGIGASEIVKLLNGFIVDKFRKQFSNLAMKQFSNHVVKIAIQALIILSFLPITFKIISLHPNENVYFNPLIGGIKGASVQNFPYWGSSLGNTYLQGVMWINKHAEKQACVGTPIALMGNVPAPKLRHDILYTNSCLGWWLREGEYAMDMVYQGYFNDWYAFAYYDKYLYPVYEVKVEGVTIFKLFKNDLKHTKPGFVKEEQVNNVKVDQNEQSIKITLPKELVLSSLNLYYDIPNKCKVISDGYFITSKDGEIWKREADNITVGHGRKNFVALEKAIERRFAAVPAKYIKLETNLNPNCKIIITKLEVFHHPDINPNTL